MVVVGGAYAQASYVWRPVPLGGGGYVTGIVAHPRVRDLLYVRTDVGGAYRWNPQCNAQGGGWLPITDHFPLKNSNFYGIESLAIDPSDSDVVYIAAGKYKWAGLGAVFKSTDRGRTWHDTGLALTMRAAGGSRSVGERLAVDPNNANKIYFGSRHDGLWLSSDGARHWRQVAALAKPDQDGGDVGFVLFDARHADADGSSRLYVAVRKSGLSQSDDGGESFRFIGGPPQPVQGVVANNGLLYVTATSGVHVYDGSHWRDLTPQAGRPYGAIAMDPADPSVLLVSELRNNRGLAFYRTSDGGKTWSRLTPDDQRVLPRVPWWKPAQFASATSALVFDPFTRGRVWLSDWYGVWRTEDILAQRPTWESQVAGIEEMVTFTLAAPPGGAALLSGVADNDGFRHRSIDAYPRKQLGGAGIWNTMGIDHHEADPSFLARVGTRGPNKNRRKGGGGYSTDNGATWRPFPNWPFDWGAKIAYSATDPLNLVVVPVDGAPHRTLDRGVTWQAATDAPTGAVKRYWHWHHPLAADRVDGKRFYLHVGKQFFRSDDGGLTWVQTVDMAARGRVYVEAAPGIAGEVWVSLDRAGLYRSSNGGDSFDKVKSVRRAYLFGFGKGKSAAGPPAVFLYGRIGNDKTEYIYRSDDMGRGWIRLNDASNPIGDEPNIMRGDRQKFGRVYIGTNGRGIVYGQPLTATEAADAVSTRCVSGGPKR